jgi:hypothetical protein
MKSLCLICLFIFEMFAASGQTLFSKYYSSNPNSLNYENRELIRCFDGTFVATNVRDIIQPQSETQIVHVDSLGNVLHENRYNDNPGGWYVSIDISHISSMPDGNFFCAGAYDTTGNIPLKDFLFAKLDSSFNVVWMKSCGYPSSNEFISRVIPLTSTSYLCLGNATIMKIDTAGNISGSYFTGYGLQDAVMTSPNECVLLAGDSGLIAVDTSLNLLWTKRFVHAGMKMTQLIRTSDNGLMMAGQIDSSFYRTLVLIKLDSSENIEYVKRTSLLGQSVSQKIKILQLADSSYIAGTEFRSQNFDGVILHIKKSGSLHQSLLYHAPYAGFHHRYNMIDGVASGNSYYALLTWQPPSASRYMLLSNFDDADSNACGMTPIIISLDSATVDTGILTVTFIPQNFIPVSRACIVTPFSSNTELCAIVNSVSPTSATAATDFYPNPFIDHTQIALSKPGSSTFILYDFSGKEIVKENFTSGNFKLDRNGMSRGIYFYEVISENKVLRGKLIAE